MYTVILLYVTVAEVPAIFTDADARIKGVQIGDHKIKQKILLITPPFFLRDIACLTRMQVILKLLEASGSKINFSKSQALLANRTNGMVIIFH